MKDEVKSSRESFLNVFDDSKITRTDDEDEGPDLSNGIKIHADQHEEESKFDLKTS